MFNLNEDFLGSCCRQTADLTRRVWGRVDFDRILHALVSVATFHLSLSEKSGQRPTNVGWALRDQQPDGALQKSKSVSVSSPFEEVRVSLQHKLGKQNKQAISFQSWPRTAPLRLWFFILQWPCCLIPCEIRPAELSKFIQNLASNWCFCFLIR